MVVTPDNPYDIFSPEAQRNHELYARMRDEDPVHCAIDPQTGNRVWFLTRYDDCLNFLKDKRFGKEYRKHFTSEQLTQRKLSTIEDIINQNMLNLDDPSHARLKSLVHHAFQPIHINPLRPRLENLAHQLFDIIDQDVRDGEEFDLTHHYISQFPLLSIADILGIPREDYRDLYIWTHHMLSTDHDLVLPAIKEFSDYIHTQIDKRRQMPDTYDDLLARLIFAENVGGRLSRQELLSMIYLLITAGYETMVNFISNSIMTLFDHPEQMYLLKQSLDQPEIVKTAIDELLRYSGPSHMTLPTWAFEDVHIRGKTILRGDVVHAVLTAANRDPLVFEHPDTFDIMRKPNKHIAFSYGIHHCLGAGLARLEGDIAIVTLLKRIPNL